MVRGLYDDQVNLELVEDREGLASITRGNQYKMSKHRNKTRLRQHYFKERIVGPWNSLPDKVVSAPSVKAFERRLDKHWKEQDIVYDYEAALDICCRAQHHNSSSDSDDDLDTQA